MKTTITKLLLLFITIFPGLLTAQIIRVPQDYATIQAGIDASSSGDTVLVDTGRYYENINFSGKNILLTSRFLEDNDTSYISRTIIDGSQPANPDSATCVYFGTGETADAILQGFTITGGTGSIILSVGDNPFSFREGGAISIEECSPTIRFNMIRNNYVTNEENIDRIAGGGAIRCRYCDATIENNVIMNNEGFHNGGISFYWSSGTIRNNVIYQNLLSKEFGGSALLIENNLGPTIIENNTIVGNKSLESNISGGIHLLNGDIEARNNIIWGNTQEASREIGGNGTFSMEYNAIQFPADNIGDVSQYPQFRDTLLFLENASPAIDAGNPDEAWNDTTEIDGTTPVFPALGGARNDMGAYGGPHAAILPHFAFTEIYVPGRIHFGTNYPDSSRSRNLIISNLSTHSVEITDLLTTGDEGVLTNDFEGPVVLPPLGQDTVVIMWVPAEEVPLDAVAEVYHDMEGVENPLTISLTGSVTLPPDGLEASLQNGFALLVFPNPVQQSAIVSFDLERGDLIELLIQDTSGRIVENLYTGYRPSGKHQIEISSGRFAPGMYLLVLKSGGLYTARQIVFN